MALLRSDSTLHEIHRELRLVARVPSRARGLHEKKEEIERDLAELGEGRWWRRPEASWQRLRDRLAPLVQVAAPLEALITGAIELESKVDRMAGQPFEGVAAAVVLWFAERCRAWKAGLVQLGAEVRREAELDRDRSRLERLRSDILASEEVAEGLRKAGRWALDLSRRAGLDPVVLATEIGELQRLVESFLVTGPIPALRDGLQSRVAALEELARRPPPQPPEEVRTLLATLDEVDRWARALGGHDDEVESLTRRYGLDPLGDWTGRTIETARGQEEAVELLERLVEEAGTERVRQLEELEAGIRNLTRAYRREPDLDAGLDGLRSLRVVTPSEHTRWLREHSTLKNRFLAAATNQLVLLRSHLEKLSQTATEMLQELEALPAAECFRERSEPHRYDLELLANPRDVHGILDGLRTAERIIAEVGDLISACKAEGESLDSGWRALEERRRNLAEAVRSSGLEAGESLLTELDRTTLRLDQKGLHGELRTTEDRLSELEKRFRTAARERWCAGAARWSRLATALATATGTQVPIPPVLAEADVDECDPSDIPARLAAAAGSIAEVERRIELGLAHQDRLRNDLLASLVGLSERSLAPQDRAAVEGAQQELSAPPVDPPAEPADLLVSRARAIAQVEELLDRLLAVEREVVRRRGELRRRFQRFQGEGWDHHFPYWSARIGGLLAGAPEDPGQAHDALHQLEVAAQLLGRLESQCVRIAAQEVATAEAFLRDHQTGGHPAGSGAAALLAELASLSGDELPPRELRRRLLEATR